jgi:glycerophosphoryl diester phosphodiesterase
VGFRVIRILALLVLSAASIFAQASSPSRAVQLGPRPFYLVDDMDAGLLKDKLQSCAAGPFRKTDFSISHRGAGLQIPEHTRESYVAAAVQGAGIIECDVAFTKDRQLVCRHSQCDLHTTTNILVTPLAAKCTQGFTPYDAASKTAASARCCTSDITLAEFKTLCGKMDSFNPSATTTREFLGGIAPWRTELYASCATLMSHAESLALFQELGVKSTSELKSPSVPMPYQGDYTQQTYAQQVVDEYKAAGIDPGDVWLQSFDLADILYWIENEPDFGRQAVFLDDRVNTPAGYAAAVAGMQDLADQGVRIVAPPIWTLLEVNGEGEIVPSPYAVAAKAAGLDIITWSLERSGPLANGGGSYYQTLNGSTGRPSVINNDGDMMKVLDVLAKQVGVLGVFSDWPATVTYYANCMGLR